MSLSGRIFIKNFGTQQEKLPGVFKFATNNKWAAACGAVVVDMAHWIQSYD